MPIDPWVPINFPLSKGVLAKNVVREGASWQIYGVEPEGKVLIVRSNLAERWLKKGLIEAGILQKLRFGAQDFYVLYSSPDYVLDPISECRSPQNKSEAMAFAEALRLTRELDSEGTFQDAIYTEKYSRLLPTYSISNEVGDDVVLGYWLSGGVPVSINSSRRFRSLTNWLSPDQLQAVIQKSGVKVEAEKAVSSEQQKPPFTLAGRPELERFLVEHVIDIIENQSRYKALGIDFPSAIILYGPPGCGKTYAIERLVEYLEWPSYEIEASSVASPYIHETSKKVASVFESAMQNAPSVIVIDEMEAFLTDRQVSAGSGQHHVEEMAEFLRRIPEAAKNSVLIVGMTNRIDMIDPAILRRGRFDHVVKVDMASEAEVSALLTKLLSKLPQQEGIDVAILAKQLCGRPLSDVSYIVREGARMAARSGKDKLDQDFLLQALKSTPSREEIDPPRKIGFAI